jgi:hypothetical protein
LDFRPLGWAASRALRELKMGRKWPGAAPLGFPPIASRGVFPSPYPVLRPQPPSIAEQSRPFFSRGAPVFFFRGAPAGHGQAPGGARPACGDTPFPRAALSAPTWFRATKKNSRKNLFSLKTPQKIYKMGRKRSSCASCTKSKKKCDPTHLRGDCRSEESKDEEGEADWEEDPYAHIRQVDLPDLSAGIRQHAIGR